MQIGKGVEWAVHACAVLGALTPDQGLKAEALAAYLDVPSAYMAKQLQALSKAGLVRTVRGARGGYQLARPAADISLWEVMAAVEGKGPAFVCTEIRQKGPCGAAKDQCTAPCPIARTFFEAEQAFRTVLSGVSVADVSDEAARSMAPEQIERILNWADQNVTRLSS